MAALFNPNTYQSQKARSAIFECAIGAEEVSVGTPLSRVCRALWVGGTGNLVLTFEDGSEATLENVPVGLFPFAVRSVDSGTSASSIVALF